MVNVVAYSSFENFVIHSNIPFILPILIFDPSKDRTYYLKHCRQFVWYIQLEVRVKWQI